MHVLLERTHDHVVRKPDPRVGSEEIRPESCESQAVDFVVIVASSDSLHLGMAGNGRLGGGPGQGGYLEPAGIVIVVSDDDGSGYIDIGELIDAVCWLWRALHRWLRVRGLEWWRRIYIRFILERKEEGVLNWCWNAVGMLKTCQPLGRGLKAYLFFQQAAFPPAGPRKLFQKW